MVRKEFELPDLGEGIAEADLLGWLVDPGDTVEEDQPIAEVETDKALAQVPSPYDGTIAELRAEEGDVIQVDDVFVVFEVEDDEQVAETPAASDADESSAAAGGSVDTDREEATAAETDGRIFAPPRVRRLAREEGVDLAAVQEQLDGDRITEEDVLEAADDGTEASDSDADGPTSDAAATQPVSTPSPSTGSARERTLAMPATRRLAEEQGVDIDAVPASEEREGEAFVRPEDIDAYAAGEDTTEQAAATPSPSTRPADAPAPGDRIPYSGIRRTIGEQMATAKFTAPHAGHHDEVEVSRLVDVRTELKEAAAEAGVDLTYLPFVVKATVAALKAVPQMNAALDEEAEEIVVHDAYHIGIAVATEAGLMVPVIKDADRKGLLALAREINDKASRARDRSIDLDEMQGSTFTITNVGPLGGEYVSPIVNHPEAGILAIGVVKQRPWVEDGEVVARPTAPLSLSVDHRIVDGAEAAQFANEVKRYLHDPHLLLLD